MIYKGILIRSEKEGKPILEAYEVEMEDWKILRSKQILGEVHG